MYIVFEGVDTSGKSTQIDILRQKDKNIIVTKEPGGTKFGLHVRDMLLHSSYELCKKAEMMLFLADRAEHFQKVIKPNSKKLIISDRGFISGMAYALSNDESLDFDFLYKINSFALDENLPQKIVFFSIDEITLRDRLGKKLNDSIEKRGIEYLLLVQKKMEEILLKIGLDLLIVDASKPIENLTKEIERFIYD